MSAIEVKSNEGKLVKYIARLTGCNFSLDNISKMADCNPKLLEFLVGAATVIHKHGKSMKSVNYEEFNYFLPDLSKDELYGFFDKIYNAGKTVRKEP